MVQDIRSSLLPEAAFLANVSTNTTTNGAAISTADFELGITFNPIALNYTDGTYNFSVQESADSGFTSPDTIPDERIIGTLSDSELTAANAQGDELTSFGVLTSQPFIRIQVVSTAVTTGSDIVVLSNKKAEVAPAVS
jgi:hypothetical protein